MTAPTAWSHAIRTHLATNNLTQQAFADQSKIALRTVESWLAGTREPSVVFQRILKRHGVTLRKYPLPKEQDR